MTTVLKASPSRRIARPETSIVCAACFAFVAVLGTGPAQGQALANVPSAPQIDAAAHILEDHHSGVILSEANVDAKLEPASLTKMLTAYVVFAELAGGHVQLDDPVRISEKAWRLGGSKMFVEVGDRVPLEALLKGVIVQSGNDASLAVAEHVAGDERAFADLMNQHAARLDMTGSHFVNASGLPDPEHYTTVRDMARLARALIRDYPTYYPWHAIKEYEFNGITQKNRNRLLWEDETVDGLKTGHTLAAGYCLVASANRDGMRLISVVMGSNSEALRAEQTGTLLRYGFQFFETHRLYRAHESLSDMRIWYGEETTVGVGVDEDLYVTV
ncbi:MAG: serine hydrolase, partial [Gammaproteobacteria bacterium]